MRLAVGGLLAVLAASPAARPPAPAAASPEGGRRQVALTDGWLFRRGGEDRPTGADGRDRAWRSVSLPHSWNRIGSYTAGREAGADLYQGVGWYRRRFATPPGPPGARRFLQFDGVGSVAEVWLNGRRLGGHRGAFSRFRFDVTDALVPGGSNLLVVRADNSERRAGSATADVLPLSGDFFVFGGIYRAVSLVTTAAAHVDLMDHGGPGLYATTRTLDDRRATVAVRTRLVAPQPVTLRVSMVDAFGRTVAAAARRTGTGEVAETLTVVRPRRWNGRADPYLYRVRAEVIERGRVVDRVEEPFGLRSVRIDPATGLYLNGRHLPLHGVSRHQDRLGRGWALTAADHAEDMALVRELGANTVRMAHYQHAPEWFDLADRAGMVVWAEIPFVNQVAWTDADASPAVRANAREQLVELIRQNRNRPGVVTWSIGNEVDIRARGARWGNHSRALLDELNALARREDPSRPTVFADCCEESPGPPDPGREVLAGAADLIGYNRYVGWYYGGPNDLGPTLDVLHRRHPRLPMSVSEYGAGGAVSQHSDDPRGGAPDDHGRTQPEEYQAYILERAWAAIAARPYLWASWVWNMFDFASPRAEGDSRNLNTKGLVTADRRTRKDAFYYLQANWSAAPVLRLTGRRYVDRAYPVTDVRAYSNAPRVRLDLNGRTVGWAACPGRICVWPGVRLAAGANTLVVRDAGGRSDAVRWRAPDPRAGLSIDSGALLGGVRDGRRYGSDAFFEGGRATGASGGSLAATVRTGAFRYRLPLPDGRWAVTIAAGPAPASFAARIGGRPVSLAPSATRTFPAVAAGGTLVLDFPGAASVAALTVSPGS